MQVTVDSENRVIVSGSGTVTGSYERGGETTAWVVEVDGAGVDWRAPYGLDVTYTDGSETWRIRRDTTAPMLFASLDGSTVAGFIMPHEWDTNIEPDVHLYRVPGRLPYYLYGPEAKTVAYPVTARVTGPDAVALADLIASQTPVALYHNEADCDFPGCPVPPVTIGVLTTARGTLADRRDQADTIYTLELQPVAPPPVLASPITWYAVHEDYGTWFTAGETGSWFDLGTGGES